MIVLPKSRPRLPRAPAAQPPGPAALSRSCFHCPEPGGVTRPRPPGPHGPSGWRPQPGAATGTAKTPIIPVKAGHGGEGKAARTPEPSLSPQPFTLSSAPPLSRQPLHSPLSPSFSPQPSLSPQPLILPSAPSLSPQPPHSPLIPSTLPSAPHHGSHPVPPPVTPVSAVTPCVHLSPSLSGPEPRRCQGRPRGKHGPSPPRGCSPVGFHT